MHKEVLSKNQLELLPLLKDFSQKGFYLAGGTALAIQIGHRESIDFDMFSSKSFDNLDLVKDLKKYNFTDSNVLIDVLDEYTLILNGTKLTFLMYPFQVKDINVFENIKLADPLSISAMKAYAIGRRSKWKDYVDMYTLINMFSLDMVINKSKEIFGSLFSTKMFLQQLTYFEDMDYTEDIIWRIDNPPSKEDIQGFLIDTSIGYLDK